MSKELIERLRADAESTDDIGLCADAADRIEELEQERDQLHADNVRLQFALADTEALELGTAEKCDQLRAQINVLREALEYCVTQVGELATVPGIASALSSPPEQSLAEYRNKVIEAFVNEFSRHVGGDGERRRKNFTRWSTR